MKNKFNYILYLGVLTVVSVISYFGGYYVFGNHLKTNVQNFYATITNINNNSITVKGMELNDINFQGNFTFNITETTQIEWRYTDIDITELEIGDNISIIFTGEIQETEPAKINDILKINLLDD